jgi:hypothetical protein
MEGLIRSIDNPEDMSSGLSMFAAGRILAAKKPAFHDYVT